MTFLKSLLIVCLLAIPTEAFSSSLDHPIPWRNFYQPIEDKRAQVHLQKALMYITKHLGAPAHPIEQVYLYLSQPKQKDDSIKKNFQLTETNDATVGEFTIYLSQSPSEGAGWGQLVHEVTHLMNTKVYDAYFEGLSTVMAQKYLEENGFDWSSWRDHFETGQDSFYAQTYFMMREVWDVVGHDGMRDFHKYTQINPDDPGKLRIDINRWIQKLSFSHQSQVKGIIDKYSSRIKVAMHQSHDTVAFMIPDAR